MFRLQNNVPEVYVDESRDYQLLLRLYDCWQGSVNYNIKSIINCLEPLTASDRVLELLATRVGFFPRVQLDSNILRYIIAAFPYIIRNKGTKAGIEMAVYAVMKAEIDPASVDEVVVVINNQTHTVEISTHNQIYNKVALRELFRYVLPFGYTYVLNQYSSVQSTENVIEFASSAKVQTVLTARTSSTVSSNDDTLKLDTNNLIGSYTNTLVTGSQDLPYNDDDQVVQISAFPQDEEKESSS